MHHVHEWEESDDEYCFTPSLKHEVNAMSTHPFKSKILATMKVEGKPVHFQVDSGATCNIMDVVKVQSENIASVEQGHHTVAKRQPETTDIKRVDTPTDWVSSLVIVKKQNGKPRICIDPKAKP